MKKITRKIAIIVLAMVMLFTVAGCSYIDWPELMYNRGFTITVRFDANGGQFRNVTYRWTVLLRPGSRVPSPGEGRTPGDGQLSAAFRPGHLSAVTWHEAYYEVVGYDPITDDPIYKPIRCEETDEILLQATPWDFSTVLGEVGMPYSRVLTLYAKWTPNFNIRFVFVTEDEEGNAIVVDNIKRDEDGNVVLDEDGNEIIIYDDEGSTIAEGHFFDQYVNEQDGGRLHGSRNTIALLRNDLFRRREGRYSLRGIYRTREEALRGHSMLASEIRDEENNGRLTDYDLQNFIHRAFLPPEPSNEGENSETESFNEEVVISLENSESFNESGNAIENEQANEEPPPFAPDTTRATHHLYTTWIPGIVEFISNASEMRGRLNSLTANFYLEDDLDFTGWRRVPNPALPPFEGWNPTNNFIGTIFGYNTFSVIRGNGFSIRNIHMEFGWESGAGTMNFGLFRIFSGALYDINFENIHIEVFPDVGENAHIASRPEFNIMQNNTRNVGFIAGQIGYGGARITNVGFIGESHLSIFSTNQPNATTNEHVNFGPHINAITNQYMFGMVLPNWELPTISGRENIIITRPPTWLL